MNAAARGSGTYAKGTQVPVSRSKAEIETLLERYGARQFVAGWDGDTAAIAFELQDRKVRFLLPLPLRDDARFRHTPTGRLRKGDEAIATAAYEAECRRRWRALALVIKAKLEAVESGITTFEAEFLSHIVLPSGGTVGDWARPALAKAYERGVAMPPLLAAGEAS